MKRRLGIGLAIVIALGVLGVGSWWAYRHLTGSPGTAAGAGAMAFEPMEAAELITVEEVDWQATADLVGTVVATRSVTVRNEFAGTVTFVGFESGQVVEPGQVLLRLDDSVERADLEASRAAVRVVEASIAQAQTQIRLAEIELARLTSVPTRAVAEVELDRARSRVESVRAELGRWQAELDQARARVAQVEARLAKLTLHAPFRARAGMRSVHEGQYLGAGSDIVALQELTDSIYIDFAISQEYAPRVRVGTTIRAVGPLLGPEPVPMTIVAADAVVNNSTRNLRVRGLVPNPEGRLVPGMAILVRVPIAEPQRIVAVPSTAIRRAAYGNSVFVVEPDPESGAFRARQRFVSLGQAQADRVFVLSGLRPGERIAAAGSFKLRDGVKVISPASSTRGETDAQARGGLVSMP
jgi:membrane fusion protein (multidrug efflux system)